MQTKENIEYGHCNKKTKVSLNKFISECLGLSLEELLRDRELVCREKERNIDIYVVRKNLVEELYTMQNKGLTPFTVGIHVARLRGEKLVPLLGLAAIIRLENKIPPPRGYVVINTRAEKLFLYGRDVFGENVAETKTSKCKENYVLVLSQLHDPLGWGRLLRRQNTIYIQNIIDAGWYLRSGV